MPGVEFDIDTASLEDLQRLLEKARREVADLDNPHARISAFLDQWVQDNFKTEGGSVPGGWEPFAFGGRINMETGEVDASAKLLQDTGRLRSSFVPFATNDNAGIGSRIPYSEKHQEGDLFNNLPAREMLPQMDYPAGRGAASMTVGERVRKIFGDHVTEIFAKKQIKVEGEDA